MNTVRIARAPFILVFYARLNHHSPIKTEAVLLSKNIEIGFGIDFLLTHPFFYLHRMINKETL